MTATADKNYNILIADDDSECREALRQIMEPQGFHIFLASCGEEAIDIVRGAVVHLVLLDMHMPTLTGLETLSIVRQEVHVSLPCILITGDATDNLMRQAAQAQVYSVIPKPVSRHVVLYTVVRALGQVYGPPRDDDNPIE